MKRMIIVGGLLLLAACDSPEDAAQTACVERIRETVSAPGWVEVVDVTAYRYPEISPKQVTVEVTYDTASDYQLNVRGFHLCEFPLENGRAVTDGPVWHGAVGQAIRKADEALDKAFATQAK